MTLESLLSRIALALGIGLLIGLERGWHAREAEPGHRTAGIRTFAIYGLLGGTVAAVAEASGDLASAGAGIVLALGFAAYAAAIALFCREANQADGTFSATTAIAGTNDLGLQRQPFDRGQSGICRPSVSELKLLQGHALRNASEATR
jgi:hypothetical protein